MNALEGIRVLDFGRYVAGPYCATLLAEFGADVLRIEKRGSNDDRYVTPVTSEGEGALFLLMARNKRSLSLDPVSEEGRKVVRRLVANSDIVVVNMSPRALVSLGLDYATLSEINPRIILVSVTAFGDEGPWKDRLGFDTIGQAMSGTTYLCGTEQQPYRSPASWVDFTTGIYGAFGALAALRERDRSGRGQMVSANLLASALMSNGLTVLEQALTSPNRKAIGNRNFGSGPTDLFRVKDGWLQVHVIGSALFARWARLMGEEMARSSPNAWPSGAVSVRARRPSRPCRKPRSRRRRCSRLRKPSTILRFKPWGSSRRWPIQVWTSRRRCNARPSN
jgi:crotonobetainyl-CoA:carnitine CoA-transferase CaiB-like acyl-CoA transferase